MSRILRADDLAEQFGVDKSTICKAAKRGDLPGALMFGRWVFVEDDVEQWVREEAARQRSERERERRVLRGVGRRQRAMRGRSN